MELVPIIQRFDAALQIQEIVAVSVDAARSVRRQSCEYRLVDLVPRCLKLLDRLGHRFMYSLLTLAKYPPRWLSTVKLGKLLGPGGRQAKPRGHALV